MSNQPPSPCFLFLPCLKRITCDNVHRRVAREGKTKYGDRYQAPLLGLILAPASGICCCARYTPRPSSSLTPFNPVAVTPAYLRAALLQALQSPSGAVSAHQTTCQQPFHVQQKSNPTKQHHTPRKKRKIERDIHFIFISTFQSVLDHHASVFPRILRGGPHAHTHPRQKRRESNK